MPRSGLRWNEERRTKPPCCSPNTKRDEITQMFEAVALSLLRLRGCLEPRRKRLCVLLANHFQKRPRRWGVMPAPAASIEEK